MRPAGRSRPAAPPPLPRHTLTLHSHKTKPSELDSEGFVFAILKKSRRILMGGRLRRVLKGVFRNLGQSRPICIGFVCGACRGEGCGEQFGAILEQSFHFVTVSTPSITRRVVL